MKATTWTALWLGFFLGIAAPLAGQTWQGSGWGVRAGLACDLGQPVNRLGLDLRAYWVQGVVQGNVQLRIFYSLTDLGPRPPQPGWETQLGGGLAVGFGPPRPGPGPWVGLGDHQTGRTYALAYGYTRYWDPRGTSQATGLLALHLGAWRLTSENDALAGGLDDRFRTGSFAISRRDSLWEWGTQVLLWTGDTRSPGVRKVRDSPYPGRYGYRDMAEAQYGAFSHGIWTMQAARALPYGQVAALRLGIDAEPVRHVLQNRLLHDMPLLPARWNGARNPHVPMVAADGQPYLFQPGQRMRPLRPYWALSWNPGEGY